MLKYLADFGVFYLNNINNNFYCDSPIESFDSPSSTSGSSFSLSDPEKTSTSVQLKDELFDDISELQLVLRLELVSWQDADGLLWVDGRPKDMQAVLGDPCVSVSGSGKQKIGHCS